MSAVVGAAFAVRVDIPACDGAAGGHQRYEAETMDRAVAIAQDEVRRVDFDSEMEREDCIDLAAHVLLDGDVLRLPDGTEIWIEENS